MITDSGDAEYMRQAMKGVQTLLLVPVREDAERTEKHMSVVDVAVAAGVRRIVYPSFPGAAPDATFPLARDHGAPDWQVEAWVSTYLPIGAGELDVVSDTVPGLTGHPALSLGSSWRAIRRGTRICSRRHRNADSLSIVTGGPELRVRGRHVRHIRATARPPRSGRGRA